MLLGQWSNPATLGIACAAQAPSDSPPAPGQPSCGNPINIGNGNKYEWADDYSTVGQNPLAFTRYYNSMADSDTFAVALGSNWRHSYDRYLHIINPSAIYGVTAERADGQYVTFSSSSGTYTTDTDLDYKLTKSGSTWTLTDPDDTIETYSQSGAEATLSTIKRRNGYTMTMHYTSGKLTSVTDSYSRALGLSYSSVGLLAGVTTPDALALSYGYVAFSSSHLLQTVSYNMSPATHITYLYENTSYPFALTGITDENGHRYATWAYDNTGRAVSSQLSGAVNFTSVTYDDATGNRLVKGPLGIVETYKFSVLQGVPKVTEIDRASNGTVASATETFLYDSNGFTKSITDWNGNNTWFTNNSHGLPTAIVYASGSSVTHTTSITYDSTWARLAHVITTPGLTSTLNYDSSGNLTTRVLADTTSTTTPYSTNGQTRTWTYTYTSSGLLTSIQWPRTDRTVKTAFGYTGGALTYTSDALGHTTTVNTWLPGGLPTKITDPNGVQTQLAYSSRLWLTSSVLLRSSGNFTTTLQYDSAGELTKLSLQDGTFNTYVYDNAHRLTKITNRLNETQNITYNSAGNMTQDLWKSAGGSTSFKQTATYDALGRMYTSVNGVNKTTTFAYDSNGNVLTVTDPLSHVTTQTFDALNRLHTVTDAATDLTTLTYDAHDRPLTVVDARSHTTSWVYDGFGDMIQQASPDSGTNIFWYDPDANVTTKKDAAIQYTSATYDALDRPLTRTYPADSTLNVAYTYDQSGHGSGIGRLTSMTDQAGSLSLIYDDRGNVTSNKRTIGATTYTTSYTWGSTNKIASVTMPSGGWKVSYTYDNAGQQAIVTTTQPGHTAVNLASSVGHSPFGPVHSFTFNNGITDSRTFDQAYRMTNVTDTATSAILNLTYGYDDDSNVTSITDAVTPANGQTLQYDVLDRIKYASSSGTYGLVSTIAYDSTSNMKTYGSGTNTYASTSNRLTQAGSSPVSTNANGNITAYGGSNSMTYSKANRLASITVGANTTAMTFDGFGQRMTATVGAGTPMIYQYDQAGRLIMETNGSGVETDYAYLDGVPMAAIQPAAATISSIHTNNLGTPQRATNASKTQVWNDNYSPCGVSTLSGSITQNLRFPGQHYDGSFYNHNGFRDYPPAACRYLEPDPLFGAGALLANRTNPYPYALANPYKYTDRTGLIVGVDDLIEGALLVEAAEALPEIVAEAAELIEGSAAETTAAGGAVPAAAIPVAPEPTATTPGAQCTVSNSGGLSPAEQLAQNRAAGAAFEQIIGGELEQNGLEVTPQITIETANGVRTRLDFLTKNLSTGEIGCVECKASATAPLTPNQSLAFPQIEQTGGTIVGAGKPGFPGGSQIPPTPVRIIRGQ